MEDPTNKYDLKHYARLKCCVFRKTKEQYGGLSNMASGFPLEVNGIVFHSSEALYQSCRFPHLPELQRKIIEASSPMSAKMISKSERGNTRPDWEERRVRIMRWCLRVKLAQNYLAFGAILESTISKKIVEESAKDRFWGAVPDKNNPNVLVGTNALGRLLTELRMHYSRNKFAPHILIVEPPAVDNLLLLNSKVERIDGRDKVLRDVMLKMYSEIKPNSNILNQFNLDFT